MELKTAQRSQVKMKLGLQGPSGSGKTKSALLMAYGLCGNWSKISVIDTENGSASLYADLGGFQVLDLSAPFTPEKYIQAIQHCAGKGMEVIVIDSISHEWEGAGGILETHGAMTGNSYTNWAMLTPRHNAFVQAILQSPAHVIGTIRSKQDYILIEKNGKQVPEKVGLKGITRDGLDYEFTLVFDIDMKHHALASKDRTGLFMDQPAFTITSDTGKRLLDWCQLGVPAASSPEEFARLIQSCQSVTELGRLYAQNPQFQRSHNELFTRRKKELIPNTAHSFTQTPSLNGNNSI
jgi:hypothetical protein